MGVLDRVGHVADQPGRDARGHGLGPLLEPAGERRALAVSRRQVLDRADLPGLVQRHEVGVVERGGRPGLADEPLPSRRASMPRSARGNFERDLPAKIRIDRQEDDPEPPAAQLAEDPELAERPAIGASPAESTCRGRRKWPSRDRPPVAAASSWANPKGSPPPGFQCDEFSSRESLRTTTRRPRAEFPRGRSRSRFACRSPIAGTRRPEDTLPRSGRECEDPAPS